MAKYCVSVCCCCKLGAVPLPFSRSLHALFHIQFIPRDPIPIPVQTPLHPSCHLSSMYSRLYTNMYKIMFHQDNKQIHTIITSTTIKAIRRRIIRKRSKKLISSNLHRKQIITWRICV